jgi:hypothetical protein
MVIFLSLDCFPDGLAVGFTGAFAAGRAGNVRLRTLSIGEMAIDQSHRTGLTALATATLL